VDLTVLIVSLHVYSQETGDVILLFEVKLFFLQF
jgi:hypothetical protein